jgi:ATP-dependent RNA helicase DDX55/SPB4
MINLKEVLILDEADRLLELGFKDNLQTIFSLLPKQRRTGLFSATQTDEIEKLIKLGLRNPCFIQVKQKGNAALQKTPVKLNNYYLVSFCFISISKLHRFYWFLLSDS